MRFRWSGPSLLIDTPAKLNLHLEVLGRRADGFHELETVMVSVDLYDTLVLTPGVDGIELKCVADGSFPPSRLPSSGPGNLVCRAAEALRQLSGTRFGAHITLIKRIPVEAGMGGGSSDAAATLVGLNRLWKLAIPDNELHTAAARLGSDLNFFIDSHPLAVCHGRGERITPQPLRGPLWFVVVKPDAGLSTAEVFRGLNLETSPPRSSAKILAAVESGSVHECGARLFNALEDRAKVLSHEVSVTLKQLASTHVTGAAMTGSGAACFGVCHNRIHAERVAATMRRFGNGAVFVLRTAV